MRAPGGLLTRLRRLDGPDVVAIDVKADAVPQSGHELPEAVMANGPASADLPREVIGSQAPAELGHYA
jgi:hypothetical protein